MKKLITKYWGLVLVVVLLSSLFVVGAPASAANYAWATSSKIPGTATGPTSVIASALTTNFNGIVAVAQSGSTIYAISQNGTVGNYSNTLYKSTDAGATWIPQTTGIAANVPGTDTWTLLAVAPDDPNVVVIVNTQPATDLVYLSTTGGTLFSTALTLAANTVVNSITVSPLTTSRYIVVGGNDGAGAGIIYSWQMGLTNPGWTNLAVPGVNNNIYNVQFSPSFAADTGLVAIAGSTTNISASVFSYNIAGIVPANGWNTAGMYFPRVVATGASLGINKVSVALDANFYLGDVSVQNGFVALDSTNITAGGIYRFDPATTITQIYGGATATSTKSISSIAWDGTNLMAGVTNKTLATDGITILRSANALTSLPTFVPNTQVKTPGTGTAPIVIFNGGVGFAFSQGNNSGVAKTTDLGKSFNAYALIKSNFNNILDFWTNSDGTRIYALTDDGVDINLWSYNTAWNRIMVLAAGTAQTWLVRGDVDVPDTIFIGQKGATLMYKSIDGGVSWTIRATSSAMADFAVQDANTVYAVSNANGNVYKSITGGFTWTTIPVLYLAGNGYSIALLKHNSLVIGTTGGGVAYSNDGATFTTCFTTVDNLGGGNTVVTATGTAAGDTIFAGTAAGDRVGKWVIGTSTAWGATTNPVTTFVPTLAGAITGIGYANGILYAIDDTNNLTYRWITPTTYGVRAAFLSDSLPMSATSVTDQTNVVNSLTMAGNVLYARDAQVGAVDDIITYSDLLIGAAGVPTPTYPINNVVIAVNSLSGNVNPFNFMWTVPTATAPSPNGYSFNVQVYLDAAGTIGYAGNTVTAVAPFSFTTGVVAAAGLGGTAFIGTPGITYYWRVRTATLAPELGSWSAMQSFNVQQLQAIVPVLSSPVNGSSLPSTQAPAFSWNPIAAATSYTFQLSTDASFATTIYATTATAAGISLPATVTPLKPGTTYFWRVSTLTPAQGEWSTVANFTVAAPVVVPTTTVAPVVTPTLTVNIPAATTTVITIPPPVTQTTEVNPSYIWAIIIIGAVLVIAVIVLIVRTRRSV